jgi:chromosome segregation ATPase
VRFDELAATRQLLYEDFHQTTQGWAAEKVGLRDELANAQQTAGEVELELARVKDVRGMEGKGEIASETQTERLRRDVMVLQAEKNILARRFNFQKEEVETLTESVDTATQELIEMEKVLKTRIAELEQYGAAAEARVDSLQKLTADWTPREDLVAMSRKYESLRTRLTSTMTQLSQQTVQTSQLRQLQREVEKLSTELEGAQEEARTHKERAFQVQKVLDSTMEQEVAVADVPRVQLMARLADLEAREGSNLRRHARLGELAETAQKNNRMLEDELRAQEERLQGTLKKYHVEHELVRTCLHFHRYAHCHNCYLCDPSYKRHHCHQLI